MKNLSSRFLVVFAALALVAATANAANSLDVNANAAMDGTNFGLEVLFDGSTNSIFVQDDTPSAETIYRFAFWLDPNSMSIPAGGRFASCFARDDGLNVVRVQLNRKGDDSTYRVRAQIRKNNGDFVGTRENGTGVKFIEISDAPVLVTVESVFAGGGGGEISINANGIDHFRNGFNTGGRNIDEVRCGARGSLGTLSGSYYFDEFESFRTLAP